MLLVRFLVWIDGMLWVGVCRLWEDLFVLSCLSFLCLVVPSCSHSFPIVLTLIWCCIFIYCCFCFTWNIGFWCGCVIDITLHDVSSL